ncbi:hydrogenase maturation protease [Sphaerisporangium sp. TRM90804]|uniref:hydrogenase maturation protease n=1 Tax=Sphaerisporangium sp. TRM90804 TaxID=3031113 RepID=UPI00244B4587|nr:hydrogenase maturation protease [Sphaerisporangium sp. TRM90804]MDH2429033.1 hydrogenase maturation protease [Sphaerisporangium sp. TRM90804]
MRILVAGVGNVFLGDDGFGVAVAESLAARPLPEGVVVADFGIRGVHLAYELTGGGYDLAILVDAAARGDPPGTLYVLRPSPGGGPGTFADAHDMTPDAVLALAGALGERATPVLLVACEPADLSPGMELSPPVAGAVGRAADLVCELIGEHLPGPPGPGDDRTRHEVGEPA